jgi:acetylornithine/N-succinyldiaminopimelate aminotransferase
MHAVALKVLEVMEKDKICENSTNMGKLLLKKLQDLSVIFPIKAIRGKGLMLGIELDRLAEALKSLCVKYNILFSITATNVIRLLPPLIINSEQIEELIKRLTDCLEAFYNYSLPANQKP